MKINDMLCKHIYNIQAKISEKQEEIIMQTIQEIGGETFYEITIDRDKVIEALTMYKNKADYAEVKHGEWVVDAEKKVLHVGNFKPTLHTTYKCSLCGCKTGNIKSFKFCRDCGAKMEGV